ncbi:DUF1194 domain-containing protein [Roseovarius sp. M141]|uniref:DUF1194 domain-containing protein n=1 Tax=Roseovarius sp. M141 TaxID=2583806 RepID=UPI0020CF3DB6|nr:DUF1194 domain-containing protein [Roseovarius sp. M141]
MVRLIALLVLLWGAPVWSQAQCRLALVLALDVSASIDSDEYALQRLGLAAALDAQDVRAAILRGAGGHVALAVFEWSGRFQQKMQLNWTALETDADIDRAVVTLGRIERSYEGFPTSIGQALGHGASLLATGPACIRKVIDVSGDGVNNFGYGPEHAYRHFPMDGVVVNGLVILGDDPAVEGYYRQEVLHGPGAFIERAEGFDGFHAAMTRKLFREINNLMLGAREVQTRSPHG